MKVYTCDICGAVLAVIGHDQDETATEAMRLHVEWHRKLGQ